MTLQRTFFALLCAVIAVPLLLRIRALWPLYVDGGLRSRVQCAITQLADERGWLLSDITIESVSDERVRLRQRTHVSGPVVGECVDLALSSLVPSPCAES